jgi:hypothetical protein
MGFFSRFKKDHLDGLSSSSSFSSETTSFGGTTFQYIETTLNEEPELQNQLYFFIICMVMIFSLRILTTKNLKTLSGEHVLNIHNLNDVNLIKEVFLAYLNAALLEPLLAIAGLDPEEEGKAYRIKLLANFFELFSLCWWIWLVTDAFDFNDVMFQYKFHYEFREEIQSDKRFNFIRLRDRHAECQSERQAFLGSLRRDIALWFMLGSIASAWLPGAVTHKDVMHAYVVVCMWFILHHYLRRATCWGIK